jgi:predicted ATP-grasp superfamily ATP-dependent carboligase
MITGTNSINNLGVIRGLGRHGVPIILLDVDRGSMVRYSKYVSKKLTCPDPNKSEIPFINFLLDFGKQMDKKCMIIPTGDMDALILSKHKDELERFYILPMPSFEVIQKLVDKKRFYKLLDQMSIPHPKTYFTEDISELKSIGQEIDYPYIIKPAYSHLFSKEFGAKNFVINSSQELNQAIEKLRDKNMEVMIQEIIQGKKIYMFYAYFNKQSEPIVICGYDKLRQYPPDFGSGSLCKSAWRSVPIDSATQVLKAIKYHGMAEPEFKRDPRDGEYKLLEINARTTTESILPARCGVDVEYTAYLDTIGQYVGDSISPKNGILWIDEIGDLLSCLTQLKEGKLGIREIFKSLRGEKEYAIFAWDDPIPFFVSLFNLGSAVLRYSLRRSISYIKSMMGR